MFRVGVGVGILIGVILGMFLTSLCVAAKKGDRDEDNKGK